MLSIVKILDETMFKDMLNIEVVYVTIGNPASGLALQLTGVHFRGELQHVGNVSEQKIKC